MIYKRAIVISTLSVMSVPGVAMALGAEGANGTAIVTVEAVPPGAPGNFVFTGVPAGSASSGASISKSGLAPGTYVSTESGASPGLMLVSITCNDVSSATPSSGDVQARTATFNIDGGESVNCVFLYRMGENETPGNVPAVPGEPGPDQESEPGGQDGQDGQDGSPQAAGCESPGMVPKAGAWSVSNFTGSMVCGSIVNMPLSPSQESGVLEVTDCGWTVTGTGMAEDTAPLTMHAVDGTSGRYTGTVGGVQDGIPMNIEFSWQLKSEEWIVGELHSEVTQQGMTCTMSRPFELKYGGS